MTERFEIQTMRGDQVPFAIELATHEGWNPGLHDAQTFYATDANGFLVGLLNGQPIGCISAVSYAPYAGGVPFGFIGCYIVAPAHRGKGYGLQLWHRAMAYLANHTIGLDGVVAQQANYRKSGFNYAYPNSRFVSAARPSPMPTPVNDAGVVPLQSVPFAELCAFDQRFFPAQRRAFLQSWITMPDATGLAYREGNALCGYGVMRKCLEGYKIGPLFAERAEIAESLYTSLAACAEAGTSVYLDVPERNPAALALAARHGMTKVFETARMYIGDEPPLDLAGIYGVTTFELG